MVDVNFVPTFSHDDWEDKIDRVDAEGPDGFNIRFNAIAADLHQLSTVVARTDAAITDFRTPPPPKQQVMTFNPVFGRVPPNTSWRNGADGTAEIGVLDGGGAFGVMNLDLPDNFALTTMRVLGQIISADRGVDVTVTLSRSPLRLAASGSSTETLGSIRSFGPGSFDLQATVNSPLGRIDTNSFRYPLTAKYVADIGQSSVQIAAVQLTFVPL